MLLPLAISIGCKNKAEKPFLKEYHTRMIPNRPSQMASEDAKQRFVEYIPSIEGRSNMIVKSWQTLSGNFAGDSLNDVVIFFEKQPRSGDTTQTKQGLMFYRTIGSEVRAVNIHEPNYPFQFDGIKDGHIFISESVYQPGDQMCCPSIQKQRELTISSEKVIDKVIQ